MRKQIKAATHTRRLNTCGYSHMKTQFFLIALSHTNVMMKNAYTHIKR